MTENQRNSLCYVGIWPCGCCQAAHVIDRGTPERRKRGAAFCSEVVKDGGKIEIRMSSWVRENLKRCRCNDVPAPLDLFAEAAP